MDSPRRGRSTSGWGRRRGARGNAEVDFKVERRSNATHSSTTDPEAMLYHNGSGLEVKVCYIGHGLMENRSGLIVDARLTLVSIPEQNGPTRR